MGSKFVEIVWGMGVSGGFDVPPMILDGVGCVMMILVWPKPGLTDQQNRNRSTYVILASWMIVSGLLAGFRLPTLLVQALKSWQHQPLGSVLIPT